MNFENHQIFRCYFWQYLTITVYSIIAQFICLQPKDRQSFPLQWLVKNKKATIARG